MEWNRGNGHEEPHRLAFFGGMPLSKISGFDIERYKKQRLEEKAQKSGVSGKDATFKETAVKEGAINRELAVLSHIFSNAIEWGWMDRPPANIKRFRENGGRITYLTVDQAQRLLQFAKSDSSPKIYPFVVIPIETSMRMMEILSIRREHIDLQRRIILIPKAKAGAREQPITTHLAEFLAKYLTTLPASEPWLFPSADARDGHTVSVRKSFRRVVKAAGLDPVQVVRHTLRHTAITHLVQARVDHPTAKRISGHKTLIMVERYAHQNGAHIQAAMEKLQRRLQVVD
jgi:integrase